jgi:hypothetical protein
MKITMKSGFVKNKNCKNEHLETDNANLGNRTFEILKMTIVELFKITAATTKHRSLGELNNGN